MFGRVLGFGSAIRLVKFDIRYIFETDKLKQSKKYLSGYVKNGKRQQHPLADETGM
jgi:hypothetical protein